MVYVNNTNSLEIPLKVAYNPSLNWKSIQFNIVGGLNTYLLAGNINAWGQTGLPAIPIFPNPPTNLSVVYNTRNLSKVNFSLEAGGEAMWHWGKRFIFIYRFTSRSRLGFIDMVEMKGNYNTGLVFFTGFFPISETGRCNFKEFFE